MAIKQSAAGCLFGAAIGDALAAPTEFRTVDHIIAKFGPDGPAEPSSQVTDDTQMMLAVGEALIAAGRPLTAKTFEPPLRRAFVEWMNSPDNDRAPGNTCMTACGNLEAGRPWVEATVHGSKGCGANMRVQPIGLDRTLDDRTRAAAAQFQAAITHGHPTALAASDLTAFAIAWLISGTQPRDLPARLIAHCQSQRSVYHEDWLGTLWQRPGISSPGEFISRGWDECLGVLDRLVDAVRIGDRKSDPCIATGDGWIAEEATATGLLCFLLFPDDPVKAVRRAAVTRGDSDSIACLAGAFAGAHLGLSAWPAGWVARIEYRDRLERLATAFD
jgi:ADP-ribosylglycohydrolase